jgi:hypothetical protein
VATIKVNGVINALCHKGESWMSIATVPDVCKTPTPGGPVPMPYPNISQASTLSGGTTTVKVDGGNMAAIKGSKFSMSSGDEPGTIGGIKSNTFKQASTWLLYSFDVKLEGKNACRFSDKKFQNNENTVDAGGLIPIVSQALLDDVKMKCGELGQYGEQQKDTSAKGKRDRDHVPSKGALQAKARELKNKGRRKGLKPLGLSDCERNAIIKGSLTIVIPKPAHIDLSETYGQTLAEAESDAKDLAGAAERDTKAIEKELKDYDEDCVAAYKKAAAKVRKITNRQYTSWLKKIMADC